MIHDITAWCFTLLILGAFGLVLYRMSHVFLSVGTRSILYGAHQFIIHPIMVLIAWWLLFGFPFDPRLWIAFLVHDLGYWGKPNMDGPEGEKHVFFGASVMGYLFGQAWFEFCLYHSRFYAKQAGVLPSKLCIADKYSFVVTPKFLYLPLVKLTGEIQEYMKLAESRTAQGEPKYKSMTVATDSAERWYNDVRLYLIKWVDKFKDGSPDTWTPGPSHHKETTHDN